MSNTGPKSRYMKVKTWKRKKTGKKYEKVIASYFDLRRKEARRPSNWVVDADARLAIKMRKYGITTDMIKAAAANKADKDLLLAWLDK